MKRYAALLETTWWLWLLLMALVVPLYLWHDSNWLALIPTNLISFIYFAHMRFDEEGNRIDDGR